MTFRYTRIATALGSFALFVAPTLAAAALANALPSGDRAIAQAVDSSNATSARTSTVSRPDPNAPLLIEAPSPEARQAPVANVVPIAGEVTVEVINTTYADVSYQLLGHTQLRTLPGRTTIALRGADVPTTLTFQRQDSGLLAVTPGEVDEAGTLSITLSETLDFQQSKVVMTIEPSGSVFLN
ncbi:MAG: hypothetical protein AAFX40_08475 [Cyanobacteria bacterium J06639_1]